jgi:hypothetical protein
MAFFDIKSDKLEELLVINQHVSTKGTRLGDPDNPDRMPRRQPRGTSWQSYGIYQGQG